MQLNSITQSLLLYLYTLEPPVIDKGAFLFTLPKRGSVRVKIGTPAFVYSGTDVTIDCKIISGTPPITIKWSRNGSPDPTIGNVSTIILTNVINYVNFRCRAENYRGFDTEHTSILVTYGRYYVW